jgi:hypothetical protein
MVFIVCIVCRSNIPLNFLLENVNMCPKGIRAHIKKINVEKIILTCGIFNFLNIKFFVSLNSIFLMCFYGTS